MRHTCIMLLQAPEIAELPLPPAHAFRARFATPTTWATRPSLFSQLKAPDLTSFTLLLTPDVSNPCARFQGKVRDTYDLGDKAVAVLSAESP